MNYGRSDLERGLEWNQVLQNYALELEERLEKMEKGYCKLIDTAAELEDQIAVLKGEEPCKEDTLKRWFKLAYQDVFGVKVKS